MVIPVGAYSLAMNLPSYFLRRPPVDDSAKSIESFERLFSDQVMQADGGFVKYDLPVPKWQFLTYFCDSKNVVVHGSGNPAIEEFEPRQSVDVKEFGDQRAVYAASDGIWSMFYAILNRDRYVRSLYNSCNRYVDQNGQVEVFYFFSINDDALPHDPWRTGTIYILPKNNFEAEEKRNVSEPTQWRSFSPVEPLAKLAIGPEDFPFLDQISGHDVAILKRRAKENPEGFPWLEN